MGDATSSRKKLPTLLPQGGTKIAKICKLKRLILRGQQDFSGSHVGCILLQGASGILETDPCLDVCFKIAAEQRLDLTRQAKLTQHIFGAQPASKPEAFQTLAFKNQGGGIGLACGKRQAAINQQSGARWLCAQNNCRHLTGNGVKADGSANSTAEVAQCVVESGFAAVHDIFRTHSAQQLDLL